MADPAVTATDAELETEVLVPVARATFSAGVPGNVVPEGNCTCTLTWPAVPAGSGLRIVQVTLWLGSS